VEATAKAVGVQSAARISDEATRRRGYPHLNGE